MRIQLLFLHTALSLIAAKPSMNARHLATILPLALHFLVQTGIRQTENCIGRSNETFPGSACVVAWRTFETDRRCEALMGLVTFDELLYEFSGGE